MKENSRAGRSAFRMTAKGKTVFVSFSQKETQGVKDNIRDILTESFEERYLKAVQQSSEEEKGTL